MRTFLPGAASDVDAGTRRRPPDGRRRADDWGDCCARCRRARGLSRWSGASGDGGGGFDCGLVDYCRRGPDAPRPKKPPPPAAAAESTSRGYHYYYYCYCSGTS